VTVLSQFTVVVAYAQPGAQFLEPVRVAPGTTVGDAIRASGLLQECPEIDLGQCSVGVFGRLIGLDSVLQDGDRIEIYRPLIADPKDARRRRAGLVRKRL
jgi:putative ubiquitin-RnfH superfamily antitoxin RatB of RatAB toxin-antitoxin module